MLPPKMIDEALKAFATPRQWEIYEVYCEHGGMRPAAEALGINRTVVQEALHRMMHSATKAGYAYVQPMELKGESVYRDKEGNESGWTKTQQAGMDPADAAYIPDPKLITSVSTFTDGRGQVRGQWTSEKADEIKKAAAWEAFFEALQRPLVPLPFAPSPVAAISKKDLLAFYPVGDHHTGMLAWVNETGDANYDLKIAEQLLNQGSQQLIDSCPPCDTALIAFMGDFFHYDSFDAVTPKSRNLVDAEGRYPKMIEAGFMMILYMIRAALVRHKDVHVIFEFGNHSPSTDSVVMTSLKLMFRDNPRVHIDSSPMHYHYFQHGKVMLMTHHGDYCKKPENLPGIGATDQPVMWGETTKRFVWTGHTHKRVAEDFRGMMHESCRILAPLDAWAAHSGYRSHREMQAVVYHKEFGRVLSFFVNPDMLDIVE